jgi:hypothetical protein
MSWNRTDLSVPEEGVVVNTLTRNGEESTLMRQGALWFIPDGSMYVYYTPMFWKSVEE